jgi:hypothetical protein
LFLLVCDLKNEELLKILIASDQLQMNPVMLQNIYVICSEKYIERFDLLVKTTYFHEIKHDDFIKILNNCIKRGDLNLFQELWKLNRPIRFKDVLRFACLSGRADIVNFLMQSERCELLTIKSLVIDIIEQLLKEKTPNFMSVLKVISESDLYWYGFASWSIFQLFRSLNISEVSELTVHWTQTIARKSYQFLNDHYLGAVVDVPRSILENIHSVLKPYDEQVIQKITHVFGTGARAIDTLYDSLVPELVQDIISLLYRPSMLTIGYLMAAIAAPITLVVRLVNAAVTLTFNSTKLGFESLRLVILCMEIILEKIKAALTGNDERGFDLLVSYNESIENIYTAFSALMEVTSQVIPIWMSSQESLFAFVPIYMAILVITSPVFTPIMEAISLVLIMNIPFMLVYCGILNLTLYGY